MSSSTYDKLDLLLTERIKATGKHTFSELLSGNIAVEIKNLVLDEIAARGAEKARPEFRILDARLQALKKRGLIEFSNGQWRAKDVK